MSDVVSTVNGALTLRRGARVIIDSDAAVDGTLEFEREVELQVADGAIIGPLEVIPPRMQ